MFMKFLFFIDDYDEFVISEHCSASSAVLLVMALSLHAVFEGLSLGLVGNITELLQVIKLVCRSISIN